MAAYRKASLSSQIAAVQLEIESRAFDKPRPLTRSEADYQRQRLEAVRATLELFSEFEDEVRAALTKAIEEKKNVA